MRVFSRFGLQLCLACLVSVGVWGGGPVAGAQTLARPGWVGSGLTVAQWWRGAVLFEVFPEGDGALSRVTRELDDLQVLGVDALLLRGVDAGAASAGVQGRLAGAYGTLEQFDELLAQASRRRIRVVVEVPGALEGEALTGAARFWLSRGVSGVLLGAGGQGAAAKEAMLRGVLRGYVGDRVLLGEGDEATAGRGGPEMVLRTIRGFGAGGAVDVGAVRASLAEASGAGRGGAERVAQIDPAAGEASGESAKARISVLLMAPGGVALRAGETGEGPEAEAAAARRAQEAKDREALAAATSPAAVGNVKRAIARRGAGEPPRYAGDAVFAWAERMIGLHRGSPAMLRGQQTLLNFDAEGAIVSVWRGASGPVLCEVVNLRGEPVKLSLQQGFAGMGLRGVFLRPVARTDAGMGAMPLGRVRLPGYGVYLGELGR